MSLYSDKVRFIDRSGELRSLQARWDSGAAEFYILWGRRRVGKTELLDRFLEGKSGVLFEVPEGSSRDQLGDLSRELGQASANRLLLEQPLTTWTAALTAIDQWAGRVGRILIVLDEFQRIAKRHPEIGGLLNRWWRTTGRHSGVFLVLSGSEISFFERDILHGPATTYGRRTGQLQLHPFGYRAAGEFFPNWNAADRLRAYAVCGGMPYYLERFDPGVSLRDNILREILQPDGVLREEARLLLHEELASPDVYFSILRAIANGSTRVSQIVNGTGHDQRTVLRSLDVLRSLFLVVKELPVTAGSRERAKSTSYSIADEYLNFWFSFVHPYLSRLERERSIRMHLDDVVMPGLDRFVSQPAFERACHQYVGWVENVVRVGRWWGQLPDPERPPRTVSREVDVVGANASGEIAVVGSCKWTNGPIGTPEMSLLDHLARQIGADRRCHHYFFSREGFTAELRAVSAASDGRIRLVAPNDLFAIPVP